MRNLVEPMIYHLSLIMLGFFMVLRTLHGYLVTGGLDIPSIIFAVAGAGLVFATIFQVRISSLSDAAPNSRVRIWFTILCAVGAIVMGFISLGS